MSAVGVQPIEPPPVDPAKQPALDRLLSAQAELGLLERSIAGASDPDSNSPAALGRLRDGIARMQVEQAAWAADPDIQAASAMQARKAALVAKVQALGGTVP